MAQFFFSSVTWTCHGSRAYDPSLLFPSPLFLFIRMCVYVFVCTDCIHENSADKTNLTASQPCFCRHVSSSSSRKDSLCSPLLAHSFFFLSFLSFLTSPVTSAHHRPPARPPASRLPPLPSSSSFSAVKFACCN